MMKLKDLLKELNQYDPESYVVVGKEDGPRGEVKNIIKFRGDICSEIGDRLPFSKENTIINILYQHDRFVRKN